MTSTPPADHHPDRGTDELPADQRQLLEAVQRAGSPDTASGIAPTTRRVAEVLATDHGPIAAGTAPWWGLEPAARALEQRGLLRVVTRLDEAKTPAEELRTTDDHGLALTDAGRAALPGSR